jgi:hypothetical protein
MSIVSLLSYFLVMAALIVLIAKFKHIKEARIWIALLVVGLILGGGPIVALLFFAINRNTIFSNHARVPAIVAPPQEHVGSVLNQPTSEMAHVPEIISTPDTTSKRVKTTGTIIGGIVGVVLTVCGLAVLGLFLLAAAVAASCANDPKCM